MNILITGAQGFISKNLVHELKNRGYNNLYLFDRNSSLDDLDQACRNALFVFHLAGVNRHKDKSEFIKGNINLTLTLIQNLKKYHNNCPIMFSSSIQAKLNNPYGKSKLEVEKILFAYSLETNAKVLVYRFQNVFGKWCKPNYNSAIATFCHNIAHQLPVHVNDPKIILNLIYIDDVINELIHALEGKGNKVNEFYKVPIFYEVSIGYIVDVLYSFKKTIADRSIPNMADDFIKKLYSTYSSYLPTDSFNYALTMNKDDRGSFTEFIRTPDRGQVSVNISKPGITKGNHWHHTKKEKFLVVSGKGVIRFRHVDSKKIIEYFVNSEKLEVVDIPVGYTHNIENIGDTDMVTIMWANEPFDQDNPDTYYLEV